MSHKDWVQSLTYDKRADTFAALVMAAMRKESLTNRLLLRRTFPMLAKEIDERPWLPGGYYGREVRDEDLTPASNDAVGAVRWEDIPERMSPDELTPIDIEEELRGYQEA